MIFALIPACGTSSRMGRPKLSLPLGDRTVLEQVIATLQEAAVEHILVVLAPHVRDLAALVERAGARALLLPDATVDMRQTVQGGLNYLEKQFRPSSNDAWLLVPADHPTLDKCVVQRLLEAHRVHSSRSLFIPTYEGKRGHPALVNWKHVQGIKSLPPGTGLNAYFRIHSEESCELPVVSPEILRDLDTPEDYEALRRMSGT